LKDAGFDSPIAEVAGLVVKGAIEAYRTQMFLKDQNASEGLTVTKVTMLAGPAFYADAKEGIKKIMSSLAPQTQEAKQSQPKDHGFREEGI
jgi:hypothetical protein